MCYIPVGCTCKILQPYTCVSQIITNYQPFRLKETNSCKLSLQRIHTSIEYHDMELLGLALGKN